MQYSDSPQFIEDSKYVDTAMPWMVVPSFLQWSPRAIENSPVAYNMMVKSFPWNGPGVLKLPTIEYDPARTNFKHKCNQWLNRRYKFNTQRCLYKNKEWISSETMLSWHFKNGYRLNGITCDPATEKEVSPGYYYLNMVYRNKSNAGKPRSAVRDLVEFIRYLALMRGAPRAVFYHPHQITEDDSPHLSHLEIEQSKNTEQLTKLWKHSLGGIKVPGSRYWLASIYQPADPAEIPADRRYEKFEEVIAQMRATQ